MTWRKSAGQRLAGYSRSNKVEAKFLLLAAAPFCLVLISKELGLSGSVLLLGLWLSVIWAVLIVAFRFVRLWRALRRLLKR
jgi:cell division protein FtsW (lipid II flippase)